MGSNSFKLMVGEMKAGGYVQHQLIKNHLGVGDDMSKTGVISPPKLKEIRQTLEKYLTVCESRRGSRRARLWRPPHFGRPKTRVKVVNSKSLHLPLEIASEERESKLAYLVGTLGTGTFAVIDNGSRTIELVASSVRGYQWSILQLGYRIAFQRFFLPAATFAEASERYYQELSPRSSFRRFYEEPRWLCRRGNGGCGPLPSIPRSSGRGAAFTRDRVEENRCTQSYV